MIINKELHHKCNNEIIVDCMYLEIREEDTSYDL